MNYYFIKTSLNSNWKHGLKISMVLISCWLGLYLPVAAQTTTAWQWAGSATGQGVEVANKVVTDASGNSYVAGYFRGLDIVFDSIVLSCALGYYDDIFIAKYDANGNIIWATRAGGGEGDRATSIALTPDGNVVLAGYYSSDTIVFGSDTLHNFGINPDIFIAKFDTAGNYLWATNAGGSSIDVVSEVAVAPSGEIFITGYFYNFILFDGITLINSGNFGDVFIAKYDTSGNVLWAKSAGRSGYDFAYGIVVSAAGDSYVAGSFNCDSISFDGITLVNSNAPTPDIFIVKYGASGNVIWAKRAGNTGVDIGTAIALDNAGAVYMTGTFSSGTLNFNSIVLSNTFSGTPDIFLVKYDDNGIVLWAKSSGGAISDDVTTLRTDSSGNCYLTGNFNSVTASFGPHTITNTSTIGNLTDIFVAKYDSSGNAVWAVGAGGSESEYSYGLSCADNGAVMVAGAFESLNFNFGNIGLANTGVPYTDIFIARLNELTGVIESPHNFHSVSVYPNPFYSSVFLQGTSGSGTIKLIDSSGRIIVSMNSYKSFTEIPSDNLPSGIYAIVYSDADFIYSFKIVKQQH